ncbi:MAG: marine proteobacterial sortase target protein [Alphaproteobacteria bacterium]|nr:marine proteobacterial sortase target protein [Alphaproteobacteria bacterium]
MRKLTGNPALTRFASGRRRRAHRTIQDFALLIVGALIFIGVGIIALVAEAAPVADGDGKHRPQGGLFLRSPGGGAFGAPAPAVKSTVSIAVSGVTTRVKLRQTFKNPSAKWVEGVYLFPLSRKAAIDHMLMRIGDREIEGRIDERAAAQKKYETAKRRGRKASLVEQERPNLFTVSVANIPPNESITVEISYQEPVGVADGLFSLRFPMVATPRYIPKGKQVAGVGGMGWGANTADVPDAERVTQPVRDPAEGLANPVGLSVTLNAGMPVDSLRSPYHPVQVSETAPAYYKVTLKEGAAPANRDFVLEWRPLTGPLPKPVVFKEVVEGETYLLAMIMPPPRPETPGTERLPREVIYILDTSGSMHGASITQAKQALHFALDRLQPDDRFNVIAFASAPTALFARPTLADRRAIATARIFLNNLKADGGTEMRRALKMSLDDRIDASRLRQLVLLTDGSVGDEAALFRMIRRGLGDSRLFTVGIGSAPNGHFMAKAARFGRGSFTFIGKPEEVANKMNRLLAKLSEPVMTDIAVDFPDATNTDAHPDRVPDLYRGAPIVVSARLPKAEGDLVISGQLARQPWTTRVSLTEALDGRGIAKLWARRKIETVMDGLHEGVPADTVRRDVLAVALPHQLMSRYTSLVAIDRPVSRPTEASLTRQAVPANPPAGWTPPPAGHQKQLQRRAQTTKGMRRIADAASNQAGRPAVHQPRLGGPMIRLNAQTATPARIHLLVAALLTWLAFMVWYIRKRLAR